MMSSKIMYGIALTLILLGEVRGHGRLIDPPARSSMWRRGFNTPVNRDDHALYCGGFQRQWEVNSGKCGVCGDPFDGPRDHEAGGKYATGVIAKRYSQGQTIKVSVDLTKSHLGWFEFRLCPNNNPSRRVTQACLDRNLLRLAADGSTRYQVRSWASQIHTVTLVLPPGVTCSQCVLQWRYNAGNSWGCDANGCCLGCGRQEQFYGCADMAISASGAQSSGINTGESFVPGVAGVSGGSFPNSPERAQQAGSGSGGFIPINPKSGSSAGSLQSGNAAAQSVIPGVQSENPAFSNHMQCHGIVPVYTQWCRKNCLAGNCSVWLCSQECFQLLG